MVSAGALDLLRASQAVASRLPAPLAPLARITYNYRWAWLPRGAEVFRDIDAHRWTRCRENPVRFLLETSPETLLAAASSPSLVARAHQLWDAIETEIRASRPATRPVAFLCAEYGVHRSLPIYSGGLGVLAGDILKEASDLDVPMVAVGLFYRSGYFHQRLDPDGWQHESWEETDPQLLPAALVTDAQRHPLTVSLPIFDRLVTFQIWRIDIGRVPLFLLDADRPDNHPIDRWITARLYEGNRTIRLAQYLALGAGGMRALRAMGIDPGTVHLNEGHAALASLELIAEERRAGAGFDEAVARARERIVFTTHTPVPAGNEAYGAQELLPVVGRFFTELGLDAEAVTALGRVHPEDKAEPLGLTPLALRASRAANGVSVRHGDVARTMWRRMYPGRAPEAVPITAITNGVHLPSWMSSPFQQLLDRYLPSGWRSRPTDPQVWQVIDAIPDEELWAAREEARGQLIDLARERSEHDRLRRGEPLDYVDAAARSLSRGQLTIGFARRLATYKRLHLLSLDPERSLRVLSGTPPLQFLFAGKAHPMDEGGKRVLQILFGLKRAPGVAERVVFLEDYDLEIARALVSGCDVWVNLPRPPLEASGTSGMKAALNGSLNLSVLDGWWAEAYDGTNGWAIDGEPDADEGAKDRRDATQLFDLLEKEVMRDFYTRDAGGIPRAWVARIKASLRTLAPRFCATRMVQEYAGRVYRTE